MSEEEKRAPDYFGGFVKAKVPPRITGIKHWSNDLQEDITEIVIGPFKTSETAHLDRLLKSIAWQQFQKDLVELFP